jgi:hypothetical protein
VEVEATGKIWWMDFGYQPAQLFYRQFDLSYTVYLRTKRSSSATGAGGLTLAATDVSDLVGWSGINRVPMTVNLTVPQGAQFDNVNVTAWAETGAPYLSQPYPDTGLPNDFTFAWTQLTGGPWGWLGTANLGTVTSNKEVNLLTDIGTVATDDTPIITVTATYNYQGQPASVQVSQVTVVWGDD